VEPAFIEFEIPYHIEVPDGIGSQNNGPMFFPQVSGFPVGLTFERTSGDSGLSGSATIKRDRLGRATKSRVRATLHPDHLQIIPTGGSEEISGAVAMISSGLNDREGRMIQEAVAAINRFLMHYRHRTKYHWIRPLVVEDVLEFKIKTDGRGFRSRTVTGGYMELGGNAGLTEKSARRLYEDLESDRGLNQYVSIHLEAKNMLDLGQFRSATLLSYMLFENWVKNAFVTSLINDGMSQSNVLNLAKDSDGEFLRMGNFLHNLYEHHLNIDFESFENHSDWENIPHSLRNKVAHEGYFPYEPEAKSAHQINLQTINEFQEELGSLLDSSKEDVEFGSLDESPFASRHS